MNLVPILLLGAFAAQLALPRVGANPILFATIATTSALLAVWLVVLARRGRRLGLDYTIKRAHLGQMCVHTSVYVYWGLHWPDVFQQAPLILGQACFLTLLEILGSWTLGRRHRLGLGAVPITFSTNLFMWFQDDWFALQYGMLVVSWLTKEFIKWDRGGQRVHIFNPSAISLALVGYVLIPLNLTHLTRAQEISQALGIGPWCYESIFAAGIIIMAIVPVAAMTAGAALTLLGLGFVWTQVTGTYHFVDTAIPIAVFLGMNLLATDPVTTPRGPLGRLIAGILYASAVFVLYDLLKHLGSPATAERPEVTVTYFDKLLFVPVLNLLARPIDRLAATLAGNRKWPPLLANNYLHMALWAAAFFSVVRPQTRFHPGRQAETWEAPCAAGDAAACDRLVVLLTRDCDAGIPAACHNLAIQLAKRDPVAAQARSAQACAGGIAPACVAEGTRLLTEGKPEQAAPLLVTACEGGELTACQPAAVAVAPADPAKAHALVARGCEGGNPVSCGGLGAMRLRGQGVERDAAAARAPLELACNAQVGTACANLAVMYRQGDGVPGDPAQAEIYRQRACDAGMTPACSWERP